MSIDVYFTDRKFNVIGVASAGGSGPVQIINDIDDQMAPNSVGRSYTGTLITDPTNSAKLANMAALGNFVLYQDPRGKYVFATIMDWPEPGYDPQSGELDFVAENGGIDLINETVGAYKAAKAMPIADYIKLFTSDSGFEIGTNEITSLTRTLEWDSTDETALARIESVATQFDNAELDFRFEIDGTAVVKRYIDIYKHIGSDKGQRLEVNTQVNSIKTTGNIYDLFTSIEATGGTPDGKDVPITLKGYKWTDPDGRYVLGADGILRDTVAVQLWSRTLSNDNPTPTNHHIQHVKTYDATTQATLLQSALADLKQANHASINYVVDVADLPDQVQVGDTVHLVDEAQGLNLSARLLEIKDSYANDTHEATLGDYLIEANQVDPALQEVANQLKTLKQTAHWYPWTRYADDDQGTGISSLPLGKAYMAVVWGKTANPSDNPADYAGHWQKVKGDDGVGAAGPKGDDGKTSYFHTAYADDVNGGGFSQSPAGKSYIGTYSDFTEADSTTASDYTWALIKGAKGDTGPAGKDITSYASGTVLPSTVASENSQFWLVDTNNIAIKFYKSTGSAWVEQPISASVLSAATFNGLEFNGVTFKGSEFISTFTNVPVEESGFDDDGQGVLPRGTGTTTMADGYLKVDGTIDGTSGSGKQTFHSEVGPSGFLSRLYTGGTAESNITAGSQLYLGQLSLNNLDTAGKLRSGFIDGEMLSQIDNVGTLLWSGTNVMFSKQQIYPSVSIDQTFNGWLLVWNNYSNGVVDPSGGYHVTPVWKSEVLNNPGNAMHFSMMTYGKAWVDKYIYCSNTWIKGNDMNTSGNSAYVLTHIYAF